MLVTCSICISTSRNRTVFGRIHRRDCHLSLFCVEGDLPSSLSVHDRSDPCYRSSMQMYRWHWRDLHLHCIHRRNIFCPCISSLTIGFSYGLPLFLLPLSMPKTSEQVHVTGSSMHWHCWQGTSARTALTRSTVDLASFPKPNLGLNRALREFVPFPVGMTGNISHAR